MDRQTIRTRISRNLGDPDFNRFTEQSVNDAIQKAYNLLAVLTGSIQKSIVFPFPSDTPYINLRKHIPDYYAPIGIYNFKTNRWLQPMDHKVLNQMRWDWERWIGEPTDIYIILDFNRIGIFPYQTVGKGTFMLWYWAKPSDMSDTGAIILPGNALRILESWATADILDSEREFVKSSKYWLDFAQQYPGLEREVNNIAKYDKNLVLQPYWPLGRYGPAGGEVRFIDNVIPGGAIDGTNPIFPLPSVPNPSSSLLLIKNGNVMFEGMDYDLVGNNIIYKTPFIPQPANPPFQPHADVHRVWYRES